MEGVSQGISSYGPGISSWLEFQYLKVSQATEVEFEYLKVSQATGHELEYLRVGMEVYPGISNHGPGISSDGDGIGVCQGISSYEGGI